jgi:hypothetical protein
MVYILIIHPVNMLSLIKDEYVSGTTTWKASRCSDREIIFKHTSVSDYHVRLELTTKLLSEGSDFTEKEYLKFTELSNELEYTFIKYSDTQSLYEVLSILSLHLDFYIDNDFGTVLINHEFMKLWNKNPSWNWLNDFDDSE